MSTSLSSLPVGFVYPVGYRVSPNRIFDPEILKDFQFFEHPYVVSYNGGIYLDASTPVAVRRLKNGRDPVLYSAIRYLEQEGPPDESMQATYNCEDALATACDYSEAGFHKIAIEKLRALPNPFQETGRGLEATTRSLGALGEFESALSKVRHLIAGRDSATEYSLTLHRLEEVHLLMLLGRLEEAETILDERREEFRVMYQYYGHRAALALLRGDEALAKALIVKAGRVDHYHCFKILWNPLLKPLESFIRRELMTEDGEPLIYQQNGDLHRICHRIQGAVLTQNHELAQNLAEGLVMHRATCWTTTHELMLALAGVGDFNSLSTGSLVLPGSDHDFVTLARLVAAAILSNREEDIASLEDFLNREEGLWYHRELLLQAVIQLAQKEPFILPNDFESLIFEVALRNWSKDSRELYLIHSVGGRFTLTTLCEPRKKRMRPWQPTDLRMMFPVTDTRSFASESEMEQWMDEKLAENAIPRSGFHRNIEIWMTRIDGWALLTSTNPSNNAPILRQAWEMAAVDPNFYFQNGPADSFGFHSRFEVRLLRMLAGFSYSKRVGG